MAGVKIKYPKCIEDSFNFLDHTWTTYISPFLLFITVYLNIFVSEYCYIEGTYIVTAINKISVSQLYSSGDSNKTPTENPLNRTLMEEYAKLCTLVDILIKLMYLHLMLSRLKIVYMISICLQKCVWNQQCFCSWFRKRSQKTTKELLLEAGRQVSTNWTIAQQVGKFYLKDFCRLLKKQYKHKIGIFLAGSVGEGFGKPTCIDLDKCITDLMTDFGFMVYFEDVFAVTAIERNSDIYIQTREKDIMPGYTKLYTIPNSTLNFPTEKGGVLSTVHLMKQLYKLLGNTDISFYPGFHTYFCWYLRYWQTIDFQRNGPALRVNVKIPNFLARNICAFSSNGFLADIAFSIYSPEWPEASDWPARNKRNWPLASDVENITKNGCHLIPKSQPNDKKKLTWRFSFSYAEVQLSKLINPVAKKCFLCLKIIGKHYLEPTCEGFKSYHPKSIFYYTLEKGQIELWAEENIEKAFKELLDELLQTLNEKCCPHFWISSIDLYEGIKKSSLERLHGTVLNIRENPAPYIKNIDGLCAHVFPKKMLTYMRNLKYICHNGPTAENEIEVEKMNEKEPTIEIICIK